MNMALLNKIGQVLTTDLSRDFKLKKPLPDEQTFIERLQKRRNIESLGKKVHLSQSYLSHLIVEALQTCPKVISIQSVRIVVLYNEAHHNFWQFIQQNQKKLIPAHVFAATELKIQQYQAGFGTVLFFQDLAAIEKLKKQIPLDANTIPDRAANSLGMAQFSTWTALADAGLGANLAYYIDEHHTTMLHLGLQQQWQLHSQLIFGSIENNQIQAELFLREQDVYVFQ